MSLVFKTEWLECPAPDHPLLAKTWARLELRVNGTNLTQVRERGTDTVRDGVYGSVLPLAQWLAANYWYLLNEPLPLPQATRPPAWLHRHWMRSGASGYSVPSVWLYRQGEEIVLEAKADPAEAPHWPVQFLTTCEERLAPRQVSEAVLDLLLRVEARLGDDETLEARQFRAAVARIQSGRAEEAWLYEACAAWGLDPDDPEDVPDGLAELMTERLAWLGEPLRDDLTLAAAPEGWGPAYDWLATEGVLPASALGADLLLALGWRTRTLQGAYELARAVRRGMNGEVGAPPEEAARRLGMAIEPARQPEPATGLVAALVENPEGVISLRMAAGRLARPLQRFELGRALFFREAGLLVAGARLLTRSRTQLEQRLSRAFAAELWAPAELLRARIGPSRDVEEAEIESLAEEFDVSPLVVAHQIENHGLGVPVLG